MMKSGKNKEMFVFLRMAMLRWFYAATEKSSHCFNTCRGFAMFSRGVVSVAQMFSVTTAQGLSIPAVADAPSSERQLQYVICNRLIFWHYTVVSSSFF